MRIANRDSVGLRNLAYRRFCKLSVEDKIPDHSVFSRARHERFRESDALRRVFEGVVAMCVAAGRVGGEAFSVDASLIKADVDKKKHVPGDRPIAWPKAEQASHAVREYLAALDAARSNEEKNGSQNSRSACVRTNNEFCNTIRGKTEMR
jgi:IS5 family transposase